MSFQPPPQPATPPLPQQHQHHAFHLRKSQILSHLSTPDSQYTDLSPKGSVDHGIRDLIAELNALDGVVTTSSCAGRVSVFVEGRKDANTTETEKKEIGGTRDAEDRSTSASAGGKGGGGRWAFVSHEALVMDAGGVSGGDEVGGQEEKSKQKKSSLHELFGLTPSSSGENSTIASPSTTTIPSLRLIRFQFEPMILHILTSTLAHASKLLSSAQSAGFRESGLQSPKSLLSTSTSTSSQSSSTPSTPPIIAIRTTGLALESIIGYVEARPTITADKENTDNPQQENQTEEAEAENVARSIVSEDYLRLLVTISNARFEANQERIERFRTAVVDAFKSDSSGTDHLSSKRNQKKGDGVDGEWEDAETRAQRKREEGLRLQKEKKRHQSVQSVVDDVDSVNKTVGERFE